MPHRVRKVWSKLGFLDCSITFIKECGVERMYSTSLNFVSDSANRFGEMISFRMLMNANRDARRKTEQQGKDWDELI